MFPLRRRNVLLQTFRTSVPLRELMAGAVAETGITADDYAVLGVIGFLQPVAPSEVSDRLGVPRTSMSRYVARFEADGLISRAGNPVDRRSYLLELTPRARGIVDVVAPRVGAILDELESATQMPLEDITEALQQLEAAARAVAMARRSTTR